jgi:hypothetical protein
MVSRIDLSLKDNSVCLTYEVPHAASNVEAASLNRFSQLD